LKVTITDPAGKADADGIREGDGGATDGDGGALGVGLMLIDGAGVGDAVGMGVGAGVASGVGAAVAVGIGATVATTVGEGVGLVCAVHAVATNAARQQAIRTMRDTDESLLGVTSGSDGRVVTDVPQRPKGQKTSGHQASAAE
jgi:hypothetical protein